MKLFGREFAWPGQTLRGILIGVLTGLVITFFAKVIAIGTELNSRFPLLILLIPAGAVVTYYLYDKFGPSYRNSTVAAIDGINHKYTKSGNLANTQIPDEISPKMGLIAILATAITHITGASGGKEGAGVQVGFACASCIERAEEKLSKRSAPTDWYLMCGASAAFGALFSSPIAGILFGTQLASPNESRLDAWLPCTLSSFSAVLVSKALDIHILVIPKVIPLAFTLRNALIVSAFALLTGLYSRLFCFILHETRAFFQNHIENRLMKVLAPSLLLLAFSFVTYLITGSFKYNGLGGGLLYDIIAGRANHYDDFFKLVMVALTFASGFAGGEVVPLLIIGAGFGYSVAALTGLECGSFATLGAVSMLSGGTNLPLVCFALALELFGYGEPVLLFLSVSLAFISSGTSGIYSHQSKPY